MTKNRKAETMVTRVAHWTALAITAAVLGGCGEEAPEPVEVVRPVKIMEIGSLETGRDQEYPGILRAADSAEVSFEVPGRIIRLDAPEGTEVSEGQVIGALDDANFRAELDIAEANLRKARSDLARSEAVYAEDAGAITLERIDGDRRAVEVADARVVQAQKAVDDTILRAPFDGVVSRRLVEVFENITAKQPIVIIENLGNIEVEINIPERDILTQQGSQRAYTDEDLENVTDRARPMVSVSSLPDREFEGTVSEIATRADPTTRTFAVRIRFDAPEDLILLPGMTARVRGRFLTAGEVRIPVTALAATPEARGKVWVIDPDTMTVSAREVELGQMMGDQVSVVYGLYAGELIAITGATQLAEGMQVSRFDGSM